MKQTLSDTLLLWLLLAVLALIQIAAAFNLALPLIGRTTVARLAQSPGIGLTIAAIVVATTLVLGLAREQRQAKSLFVAGLYAGVGITSLVLFDIGTGMAFIMTAAGMYRRYAPMHAAPIADVPASQSAPQ